MRRRSPNSSFAIAVPPEPPGSAQIIFRPPPQDQGRFLPLRRFSRDASGLTVSNFQGQNPQRPQPPKFRCLASALRELKATLRGEPPDVPFQLDSKTLEAGAHFTFSTPFGALDILDRPDGAPPYEQLKSAATLADIEGERVRVASLDHLIAMKETAGRPKDKLMATEYRTLSDELRGL